MPTECRVDYFSPKRKVPEKCKNDVFILPTVNGKLLLLVLVKFIKIADTSKSVYLPTVHKNTYNNKCCGIV